MKRKNKKQILDGTTYCEQHKELLIVLSNAIIHPALC